MAHDRQRLVVVRDQQVAQREAVDRLDAAAVVPARDKRLEGSIRLDEY